MRTYPAPRVTLPEPQVGPATLNPGPWEPLFFSTRSLVVPPTKHEANSEGALSPTVFSPQPTATRLKAPCSRMPHHADPATPGPRVTGPAGLSTEFSWGGRMPPPRGWTPMSAHLVAPCPQNSQTRVLPMSQDRGLSVFNQSMPMTEPRFWCRLPALRGTSRSARYRSPIPGAHRVSVDESPGRALPSSKFNVRRCNAQSPFAVPRSKQSCGASRTHAAREPCTPASNPHAHRVHVRPLATLAPSYPPVPPHAAHVLSVHVAGSFA